VLGLYHIDPVHRRLQLRFSDLALDWCEGAIPTPDGRLELRWSKAGDKLAYRLKTPRGWQVEVKNLSGKQLVKQ